MGSEPADGDRVQDYFKLRCWDQDRPGWTPSLLAKHMQDLEAASQRLHATKAAVMRNQLLDNDNPGNCRPCPKCVISIMSHNLPFLKLYESFCVEKLALGPLPFLTIELPWGQADSLLLGGTERGGPAMSLSPWVCSAPAVGCGQGFTLNVGLSLPSIKWG